MTGEQLQRELRYRVAMSLIRELRKEAVISEAEYRLLNEKIICRFQSILVGLSPDKA